MSKDPIALIRGVLQGDTLSVLLFSFVTCLISHTLKMEHKLLRVPILSNVLSNHLFYVDDLKLYEQTQNKQHGILSTM